jgi:hypothetical protein
MKMKSTFKSAAIIIALCATVSYPVIRRDQFALPFSLRLPEYGLHLNQIQAIFAKAAPADVPAIKLRDSGDSGEDSLIARNHFLVLLSFLLSPESHYSLH